jgi:hypothetical protein
VELTSTRSSLGMRNLEVVRRARFMALISISLLQLLGACATDSDSQGSSEETGSLLLPLVTTNPGTYRLRDAVFEISRASTSVLTLDSEADPDVDALTADLNPGRYTIDLADGWTLEELLADGSTETVRAALVSQNPATFAVRNERATTVAYTFTTTSGDVTFGEGTVNVRLNVADQGSLGSCDIRTQAGCAGAQQCILANADGDTICATPGDLPVGSPCSSEQCVPFAQCLSVGSAEPVCTQLCDPENPPFGCDCQGLSFADDVGVCGPPPAGACDPLDQTTCEDGLACQLPGGSFGVCGEPGSFGEGEGCFEETCQAGMDCFGDDPMQGQSGTCMRFCDLRAPECEFCFDVGTGHIGRCFL